MNTNIRTNKPRSDPELARRIVQRGAQVVGILVFYGLLLFVSAGRLDWVAAWIFLAIYAGVVLVNMAIMLRTNPELAAERGQVKEDVKAWDKLVTNIAGLYIIAGLIVPGLDVRFGWSPQLVLAVQAAGFVTLVLGYAAFSWAMLSNAFFETKVRIQEDRGHTVATNGPYRYVRHPGYVGMILQLLATPVALGSAWGLVPAAGASVMFVLRTALEDRTLQNELAGYADYARQVRYRLIPGLW